MKIRIRVGYDFVVDADSIRDVSTRTIKEILYKVDPGADVRISMDRRKTVPSICKVDASGAVVACDPDV